MGTSPKSSDTKREIQLKMVMDPAVRYPDGKIVKPKIQNDNLQFYHSNIIAIEFKPYEPLDSTMVLIIAISSAFIIIPVIVCIVKKYGKAVESLLTSFISEIAMRIFGVCFDFADVVTDVLACLQVLDNPALERYHTSYLVLTALGASVWLFSFVYRILSIREAILEQFQEKIVDKFKSGVRLSRKSSGQISTTPSHTTPSHNQQGNTSHQGNTTHNQQGNNKVTHQVSNSPNKVTHQVSTTSNNKVTHQVSTTSKISRDRSARDMIIEMMRDNSMRDQNLIGNNIVSSLKDNSLRGGKGNNVLSRDNSTTNRSKDRTRVLPMVEENITTQGTRNSEGNSIRKENKGNRKKKEREKRRKEKRI